MNRLKKYESFDFQEDWVEGKNDIRSIGNEKVFWEITAVSDEVDLDHHPYYDFLFRRLLGDEKDLDIRVDLLSMCNIGQHHVDEEVYYISFDRDRSLAGRRYFNWMPVKTKRGVGGYDYFIKNGYEFLGNLEEWLE